MYSVELQIKIFEAVLNIFIFTFFIFIFMLIIYSIRKNMKNNSKYISKSFCTNESFYTNDERKILKRENNYMFLPQEKEDPKHYTSVVYDGIRYSESCLVFKEDMNDKLFDIKNYLQIFIKPNKICNLDKYSNSDLILKTYVKLMIVVIGTFNYNICNYGFNVIQINETERDKLIKRNLNIDDRQFDAHYYASKPHDELLIMFKYKKDIFYHDIHFKEAKDIHNPIDFINYIAKKYFDGYVIKRGENYLRVSVYGLKLKDCVFVY